MVEVHSAAQEGALGGGCVDGEVNRQALNGLNDTGEPEVLTLRLDVVPKNGTWGVPSRLLPVLAQLFLRECKEIVAGRLENIVILE